LSSLAGRRRIERASEREGEVMRRIVFTVVLAGNALVAPPISADPGGTDVRAADAHARRRELHGQVSADAGA